MMGRNAKTCKNLDDAKSHVGVLSKILNQQLIFCLSPIDLS
jgi:hypothetical protein